MNLTLCIRNPRFLVVELSRQFQTTSQCFKYQTNTELVHRGTLYGHTGYQKQPNDPRVPSNKDFGKTLLDIEPSETTDPALEKRKEARDTISRAMKVYLERAKKHNEFMQEQEEEFEMGRRHLANMMGLDPVTMSQNDIDSAVKYLMPSGLFDPRARPRLRPPREIYPAIKEAQFRANGRPFHSMFYTKRANFYQACHDLEAEMARLAQYEDSQIAAGIVTPPPDATANLKGSEWLSQLEMKSLFLERLHPIRYESLLIALERLASHPYSKLSHNVLMRYRKEVKSAAQLMEIPPLRYDENGRPYQEAVGNRKHCYAYVTVRGEGTGKVDINGRDILYFQFIQDREQVMTPLTFTGLLGKVDIECRTVHEEYTKTWSEDWGPWAKHNGVPRELGTSAQSGAIRYALSLALKSFVDTETVEKMRLAGLLSHDSRAKARKKWGQEGARRKYTWKKR